MLTNFMTYKPEDVQIMRIKVAHIRNNTNDGGIHNLGGRTVAAVVDDTNHVVRFSIAMCSNSDNYNKQYGRKKAVGRLFSDNNSNDITILNFEWKHLVDFIKHRHEFFGGSPLSGVGELNQITLELHDL